MKLPHKLVEGVYRRDDPPSPGPLVIDLPQSGTHYPPEFDAVAPLRALQGNVSLHVDALYADAVEVGAAVLAAIFANSVIEPNRSEDNIDESLLEEPWPGGARPGPKVGLGIGLIAAFGRGRIPIYDRKLTIAEVQARIERYHRPYHAELARMMDEAHARFGRAYHLNCHRMGPVGTPMSPDPGEVRADFCIGDRDGTSSAPDFRDRVASTLSRLGYTVAINRPFKGQEILRRLGDPGRDRHSLQIEINSRLYLEADGVTRSPNFGTVRGHLREMVADAVAFAHGATAG
jgi:N-formylglutamate amidohydrolase